MHSDSADDSTSDSFFSESSAQDSSSSNNGSTSEYECEIAPLELSSSDAQILTAQLRIIIENPASQTVQGLSSNGYTLALAALLTWEEAAGVLIPSVLTAIDKIVDNTANTYVFFSERIANAPLPKIFELYKSLAVPEGTIVAVMPVRPCDRLVAAQLKAEFPELHTTNPRDIPSRPEDIFMLRTAPRLVASFGKRRFGFFILDKPLFQRFIADLEGELE